MKLFNTLEYSWKFIWLILQSKVNPGGPKINNELWWYSNEKKEYRELGMKAGTKIQCHMLLENINREGVWVCSTVQLLLIKKIFVWN